ncbi:MAG TPA: beta-ketoacyl-ACP synthase 3, partial [Roseimicrobium sp.]|nr:beta-ketoacyl-ACP synthase 3 [Roseimicrobium sp.]
MTRRAAVLSIGASVPEKILTNADLARIVDTSDEWISQRTGMKERRICGDTDTASSLSIAASKEALQKAGVHPEEIDMIVTGTVTGDYIFPSTSCLIQDAIGAKNAGAFDVGAACAGFVYSMATAAAMIETGQIETALVIGVDVLTKYLDWKDRSTCILFGDGAGAVILRADTSGRGVIRTVLMSDGSGAQHIKMEAGGSLHPMCNPASAAYSSHIFMAGAEVYRFAVNSMGDACLRVLEKANMS